MRESARVAGKSRRGVLASPGHKAHLCPANASPEARMTQTNNRLLDEMARLMNDVQTFMRSQAERILRDMDVVTREEHEAVKEMAARAREESERLAARLAEVEKKLGISSSGSQ